MAKNQLKCKNCGSTELELNFDMTGLATCKKCGEFTQTHIHDYLENETDENTSIYKHKFEKLRIKHAKLEYDHALLETEAREMADRIGHLCQNVINLFFQRNRYKAELEKKEAVIKQLEDTTGPRNGSIPELETMFGPPNFFKDGKERDVSIPEE